MSVFITSSSCTQLVAKTQCFHTGFCLAGLSAAVHFDLATWQGAQPTVSICLTKLGACTTVIHNDDKYLRSIKWLTKFSSVTNEILLTSRTLHMKTVCTRLPLSLLTHEPAIKANLCHDLIYTASRHLQEHFCHLVVEMWMLSSMSSTKCL